MILVWVVGEGGRAMRSSISEMDVRGAHRQDGEEVPSVITTHQIPFLETPGAGGLLWTVKATEPQDALRLTLVDEPPTNTTST